MFCVIRNYWCCVIIPVVYIINNQTSKDKRLMSLLRCLVVSCMQHNIMIRAKHIPGLFNVAADAFSRFLNQVAFDQPASDCCPGCPSSLVEVGNHILQHALAPDVLVTYKKRFDQFMNFATYVLRVDHVFPASTATVSAFVAHLLSTEICSGYHTCSYVSLLYFIFP